LNTFAAQRAVSRLFLAVIFLSACEFKLVESNSTSGDRSQYQIIEIDTSSPKAERFSRAKVVLISNCAKCHTLWAGYGSDSEFEAHGGGLVQPGSLGSSSIYYRLKGSDIGARQDMPQGAPQLSETEMQTLREWIEKMDDPDGA